jgi:hypothetical protein
MGFASRDSTSGGLTVTTTTLAPGGIHPVHGQMTGGDGAVTGTEVQFKRDVRVAVRLARRSLLLLPLRR